MRTLALRYPDLALPFVPLGRFPTRTHRLDALSDALGSELWVKRDDETGTRYGGNKVRKLEWILGEARESGARRILTLGAVGSHHVLATGIYARMLGIETTAVLVPQPMTPHVARNLEAGREVGIEHVHASSDVDGALRLAALAVRLTVRDGAPPHLVTVGGSSATGTVGYVEGGLELAAQIERGELPRPDEIYVALGSGATTAGLVLGLALAGLSTRVVGVRVTGTPFSAPAHVAWLARRTLERLRSASALVPQVALGARSFDVDADHIGAGYGVPTTAGEEAARLAARDGLSLDPTYTAKAFAALVARARTHPPVPRLYWHTLGDTHPPRK